MQSHSLAKALEQVLENYQRCGLTCIPRGEPSDEILALAQSILDARQGKADALLALDPMSATSPALSPHALDDRIDPSPAARAAANGQSDSTRSGTQGFHAGTVTPSASGTVTPSASGTVTPSASGTVTPSASGMGAWTLPMLGDAERQERLRRLDTEVKACRRCKDIVGFRHQTVFGVGPFKPTVCFMGEAPGADEDRQGEPFVGRAGQLLTKIIGAMKLKREEVYILNALKCRPPQNRTPVPDEIENCRQFVETQLEILQPSYLVCLGSVAVRSILQSSLSIGRLRGHFHAYRGAKVVVTYHPSYLLRNEGAKRLVWEDMKMLMREMGTLTE